MASTDPGPGFQLGDTAIPSTIGPIGVGAPAVRASDLLGSHRTVDTLVERDAIGATYRDEGMSVWVTATSELYRLVGGIANGNWVLEGSATGGGTLTRDYAPGVLLGDVVYQTSTSGLVDRADASAVATGSPLGMVRAIDSPSVGECLVVQVGEDLSGFVGLVAGTRYILSTAPGAIVDASDTGNPNYPAYLTPGSGEVLAPVGTAGSTTTLAVNTTVGIRGVG